MRLWQARLLTRVICRTYKRHKARGFGPSLFFLPWHAFCCCNSKRLGIKLTPWPQGVNFTKTRFSLQHVFSRKKLFRPLARRLLRRFFSPLARFLLLTLSRRKGAKKVKEKHKKACAVLWFCYASPMQDILSSLTAGSNVNRVRFFKRSGERVNNNGEVAELSGIVVNVKFAETTQHWVCTLETAKGPRSFPLETVSALKVNGEEIR